MEIASIQQNLKRENRETSNGFSNWQSSQQPLFQNTVLCVTTLHMAHGQYKTRTTKVVHKAPGMCGQEYVWTDQHINKVKFPKIKLRVYSTLPTSFVFSSMLKSLCLSLFDSF